MVYRIRRLKVYRISKCNICLSGHSARASDSKCQFTASPGETVAFIGSTGSGKSTLIQLIPRFYDVSEGKILVDGVDVRDYRLSKLRDKIGFIPAKKRCYLLERLPIICDMGKKMPHKKKMERAAEIAQASEFISRKPDGFDEHLSEGGSNFSGGQKQRLAIARAIIRRPEILYF